MRSISGGMLCVVYRTSERFVSSKLHRNMRQSVLWGLEQIQKVAGARPNFIVPEDLPLNNFPSWLETIVTHFHSSLPTPAI